MYSIVVNLYRGLQAWEYPCGPLWLIISGHVIQFQYSVAYWYDLDAHVSQRSQPWLEELGLSKDEEKALNTGKWLNDTLIDAGQKLLQQQFGDRVKGLQVMHNLNPGHECLHR